MSNVYISKALRKDIPSDAILLTQTEVLDMQWHTLRNWTPSSEVWPFRYGIGILAGLNAATTASIVGFYRNKLKLGRYGRTTMYLPTVVLPTILSCGGHFAMITQSIILGEECPLCIQTRSAAIQIGLGVMYPIIVSPIAGFYYATTYGTYNVPPLRPQYFKELLALWVLMAKRLRSRFPIALAVNGFAASGLVYFEMKSLYHVQNTIREREEAFRNSFIEENSVK